MRDPNWFGFTFAEWVVISNGAGRNKNNGCSDESASDAKGMAARANLGARPAHGRSLAAPSAELAPKEARESRVSPAS